MDGYRQRTIAELLKKTYKLNRPRMTPILEGKDRMQGPLDSTDTGMDFASLQVCGNCRNHLDATIAQNCGICNRGYHSFCLEAPLNSSDDRSLQCCYYCQHQAALDSHQPGPSSEDAHNKLTEDGMDVVRLSENVQDGDEPGMSYDASEHWPVTKGMDLSWNDSSPKRSIDSDGTIFDTLYKTTKSRAARKSGIRRKRILDSSGNDGSNIQVLPSDTDTLRPALQSSGADVLKNASKEVGGATSTCPEAGVEERKEHDSSASCIADFPTVNFKMKIDPGEANGDRLHEAYVVSPNKGADIAMEEIPSGDELIKEGIVPGAVKMIGRAKIDVALMVRPVSRNADMLSEDCLMDNGNTISGAPPSEIREEMRVVGPSISRDSAKEVHSSNEFANVATKMVEEHDVVGDRQAAMRKHPDFVERPKQDDDAARLMSSMSCDADVPPQNTIGEGTLLPTASTTPAIEPAKNKSSCLGLEGQDEDDMVKPLIFVDVRGTLPPIREEPDEHYNSDGLANKAGRKEELPPKEYLSSKAHMGIDSTFTGSETTLAATLDSPNDRDAMEDYSKVCDICGDAGYEDMLAICSECNGAEHVYCYQNLMAHVPEGYWQCDRCRSKQKSGDFRPSSDIRSVSPLPTRLPSFNSTRKHGTVGNARSRLSALLQKRKLPSEKKRAMKGVPSSQFPAKRGIVENAADAPPAKKQAVEVSSPPPYILSSKLGLSREGPIKIPDTGKVKFVSHTALMSISGEGTGLPSRANSKSPLLSGSPSAPPLNFNPAQSGGTSKARFSSASNSIVGTGGVKVNTTSQLNVLPSSAPLVTSGLKTSGALKSSESLPSFLLPSKSTSSKLPLSSKGLKEATDSICPQSLSKEGFSNQSSIANPRALSKTSSFKLSKVISSGNAVEPKSKNDANLGSTKPSGSKFVHAEVGIMKSAENKHDVGPISSLAENRSKAVAPTEARLPLEIHNGVNNSNKSIKHDVGGSLQVANPSLRDETVLVASGRSEAHQIPVVSRSMRDAQDLSIEQDKNFGFQVTSPISLARQTSKLSEQVGPDTLKEVSKTSAGEVQWAGLLPCPVIVVQETPAFKAEENKALHLAVNVDAVGEKSPSASIDKAPTHDDNRSGFTPRSRSFGAWGSPSYVPSLGSTRCYRCKELGHSAKNCNNRSSMPCISSEAAGALKTVLPTTNVDSTSVLKGVMPTYSMDNATRIVQNVVEVAPKIKLTTEMAPIIKPLSTERALVSVQNLNSVVGEAQARMQESQTLESIVPLALPLPKPLVDQQTRKDTMAHKPVSTDFVPTPTQVSIGGADNTDDMAEITGGKKEDDIASVWPTIPTNLSTPSGTQLTTSSAECQPPVFSVPSIKNALSAALGSLSSAKATTPFVSRYQESLNVYPEAQIVWKGTFEVTGKAKPQASFHGLQANPSNRALPKVLEVAKKLHPLLPLEELPRGSEHNSWPVQFQKSPPINDNIALYFFASSKESYVQYYKPLVDHLIKFNLTLKGSIEDAELLIFPSNLLPPGSQCWNNFMFLWAVFRARKPPLKPPNIPNESKQAGSDGGFRLPLQSGVLTWGRGEDMQIDTIGNKNIDTLHVVDNKPETASSNIAAGVCIFGPCVLSDADVVVCEQQQPCQQELQHFMQVEAVVKERYEQKAQTEPVASQPEKAVAMLLPSTQDSLAVVKIQPLSHSLPPLEGGLRLDASNELSQIPNSSSKLEDKVDTSNKLVAPTTAKVSSVLLRSEHGSTEKAKHSTPLMGTSPALLVCPSPRDRQEDLWTSRKLSSHSPAAGHQDKDKGVRERINDKSDRIETGKGVSRDRDREKQRDRDKHKERDRDRDRSRRHSDWEREKERDRGKERERDRDRDRDRDRGRERERDRERWRDREERERRGRDWDRDRDKVGERDKGRERGREREAERERAVPRDRSGRHRSEADYGRSGRHWHRYPRSRTPSRSPPANRDWSPSRPRLDRYHHRYRRSSRHSRSYSPSPDSDHGVARVQPRAESRELSKDSFAHKGKSPDIVVGDSRAKEESAVKASAGKDLGGDEAGNFSQRGSNSNSLCREKTVGMERKLPIADLNLSPLEIEANEEGNEDDVTMSVEVVMPLSASPDDHTSGCHEFFTPNGGSGSNEGPGECSISVGKIANNRSTERLICVDGRTDSLSHSLMNDSSGPSLFPPSMSIEGSSSCLQFFPQVTSDDNRVPSAPDLNLALGAKEQSLPQQGELPLFMQLLKPCQESLGAFNPLLDLPMVSEQADLSLSLAIPVPEHSKRPVVNTSLRLFG